MKNALEPIIVSSATDQVPEHLREALEQIVPLDHIIRFVAYTPELVISGFRWPESLLALSDDEWCLITSQEDHTLASKRVSYADTVLVERTSILLYGQLRIDYAVSGATRSVTLDYDNTEHHRFNEAAQRIVSQVESVPLGIHDSSSVADRFEHWPLKFREAAAEYLPGGHHLLRAACWPAVRSGISRELAPAATLIVTQHEYLLLSEDRTWMTHQQSIPRRYGVVATYFPRVRVARTRVIPHERFSVLSMELHASHGGEAVEVVFPRSSEAAVKEALTDSA